MKVVVQRVSNASVTVDGQLVSSIKKGLCILVGLSRDDTDKDLEYMSRKVLNLRVFEAADGKRWACGVRDSGLEVLCVSQFTLYGKLQGNKPDFRRAMGGVEARQLYQRFVDRLRDEYSSEKVKDGLFAAYMQVSIQNDGPVTITLESPSGGGADGSADSAEPS
ncbi:D-aminoacyl-tRNA deacylase-like [Pollicipes pollicipes]|uniref:D-aminoacyl-tRNA deacylase-like n=1 Tax=Pollicipes pollicipes TaxID=41117 RepID=UPI001884E8F2|nr:D-aminoacyl-tRNA deacylase-like [Pollicipes pollicipes]XP_037088068.1 D-aminoacyl-tRNA deacylase-like [Pollicipes pollicipes]XP_037088075.1 D-aminoacyl-tRNA deacylase-like [Pollicipes pollicipes]XP_037088080.1 D-aminoacyl-tRNA deacylase-like [Pollicipes pollicipes]XP_037088089.1 D-aminoacyl-tRNA deacylase-like [Pollicipes pollicipes]XP_037088098.1 D-aminoacyl-tRNA deacylase-like [Pollicipes pollicipes]XP_037088106.1 D-aminoacyl-tRNA deacylase-like [Pollicipes pollicipes]XP_037088803.1 D-a